MLDADFNILANQCAPWVAPQTLAAIVKTESSFNPLVININGGTKLERQPSSKEEAVITAKWLIEHGYNVDLGLGQVNSVNLSKTKLSVEDAFDACKNLAAAATILKWNYESAQQHTAGNEQSALMAAISAYNTGSYTRGFSNGYVKKVVNNAATPSPSISAAVTKIQPIKLVNLAKISSKSPPTIGTKPRSIDAQEKGEAFVVSKVNASDGKVSTTSIYQSETKNRSVMVYR